MMQHAYIGIGANLGQARQTVLDACSELAALTSCRLLQQSALYGSAPLDSSGDDYVNAVALLETSLSPLDLLHQLQAIENAHGRLRPYRNAPRTLDLDLLLYGDLQLDSRELQLPHPRMNQRAFVLLPLLEISPDLLLPQFGPAADWLASVSDQRISRLAAQ